MQIPVIITLINVDFDKINCELERFTPLINNMAIKTTERIERDTKAIAAVSKKAFKTLFSFCLYAITTEKKIIERYIKNSIIMRIITTAKKTDTDKLPVTIVEINNCNVSNNVGEANIIRSEIIKVPNPNNISIIDVKALDINN